MRFLANLISFIAAKGGSFWEHLALYFNQYSTLQIIIDVLIVAALFYWLIMFVRGTRAYHILIGLIILGVIFIISQTFDLLAVDWILRKFLTVLLVAIPIIFQQELRRGLEKLGQSTFFSKHSESEVDFMINQIVEACVEMAEKKIGALLVFKEEDSLKEYADTGIQLNAKVSKELILNIFQPRTPLHDGAIIIERNLIIAATCTLPHSFKSYGHDFGTRHKAALALSESTDAKIIVLSEERGKISFVNDGNIQQNISPENLKEKLITLLKPRKEKGKKGSRATK